MSKQTLNRIIQNQVDLILFEEGSFSPLNWLLREGHLDYNDYQKWRKGESEYLEDHFKTSTPEIITALETAQDYACSQNLESHNHTYSSTTNKLLQFCRLPANELIYTTVYEPAHGRMQMDLFFDSAPVCAEVDLVEAIADKQNDKIPDLLTKLKSSNPEKHQQFTRLLAFAKNITQASETSAKKIKLLQTATPLAFDILGRFAHNFLTPLWQLLSVEIADRHFDANVPEHHLSFTAFKGFQWQQVLSSIEGESNWIKQPILQFRYAEASFKLNKEQQGIATWFRLFIQFPEAAERMIENTCNRLMFADWKIFSELDPELGLCLFPAWMVMKKPALAKSTVIFDYIDDESLQLIIKLVSNNEDGISEMAIHLRARLQQLSPVLFVHYMRTNERNQRD